MRRTGLMLYIYPIDKFYIGRHKSSKKSHEIPIRHRLLQKKAVLQTDINLYTCKRLMKKAAILKFKMAAVIGKILRGTDPQKNSYNNKSTPVPSFMLLSKSAQSIHISALL